MASSVIGSKIMRLSRREQRRQKQKQKQKAILILISVICITIACYINCFSFSYNTKIDNTVDCSFLTVKQVYSKLKRNLSDRNVNFMFADNCYTISWFDCFENISINEIENFLKEQKTNKKEKDFNLSHLLNEDKLKAVLKEIFRTEKMTLPQDAYIAWEDDSLTIVPEICGTYINFDEACKLASSELRTGSSTIDFRPIVEKPTVLSSQLETKVTKINSILATNISFFNADCSITLDRTVLKKWININPDGSYQIDIENNLPNFLENLREKIKNSFFMFPAEHAGTVPILASELQIDEEAIYQIIKKALLESSNSSQSYQVPFIVPGYIEIDIARQHVWLYQNDKLIVNSDCVTGTKEFFDTPKGVFFLSYKEQNAYLSLYGAHVDFWMPFNGHIGMHDANWRVQFGDDIYITNGSHGCVNLPLTEAGVIFENITELMPIIVY